MTQLYVNLKDFGSGWISIEPEPQNHTTTEETSWLNKVLKTTFERFCVEVSIR